VIYTSKNNGKACPSNQIDISSNCDVDCSWNGWTGWSGCDIATGKRTRTANVIFTSKNNGTACPSNQIDISRNCNVDCSWNGWTDWSGCNTTTGKQTRTANVIFTSKNNGIACPLDQNRNCNVNCQGEWNPWSECNAICPSNADATCSNLMSTTDISNNQAIKTRTYKIIFPGLPGGVVCPFTDNQLETEICSKECFTKCEGEWRLIGPKQNWSECDAFCPGNASDNNEGYSTTTKDNLGATRNRIKTYQITKQGSPGSPGCQCPFANNQQNTESESCSKQCRLDCITNFETSRCEHSKNVGQYEYVYDPQQQKYINTILNSQQGLKTTKLNFTQRAWNGGTCYYDYNDSISGIYDTTEICSPPL
jgi:hypothetical protein